MGTIWGGLDRERYDRSYGDGELIRRIGRAFRPQGGRMALISLVILLDALFQIARPLLIRRGIDMLAARSSPGAILALSAAILGAGVLAWVFNYLRQVASARVTGDVVLRLRLEAFRAAIGHDLSFFDENESGRIVSRIAGDTEDMAQVVSLTTNLASQVALILPLLVILFAIHWPLALLVLAIVPLVVLAALGLRRLSRPAVVREKRMRAAVNANVSQSIGGIAVAKAFRQERTLYEAFRQVNAQAYRANLARGLVLETVMFPAIACLRAFAVALALYAGGLRTLGGQISPGTWYLFIEAFGLFLDPLLGIASFWSQFQEGLTAAERVFALLDVAPRVVQVADEPLADRLRGAIAFRGVRFAYRQGADVLRDFDLTIAPGETVAFVGHTGAGKSSLVRLIARFYEFQEGQILVDGRDIRFFDLPQYRRQIGLVPQSPFLFSGTLLDNIRYGVPEATEEQVRAAARRIGGGDWLEDLPDGLQTEVGERGADLSMGQRQLVALARVLIQDPAILLLDEATASVDPFTEAQIQEGLAEAFRDRTSIVVAHRLSTVEGADRIVVLEEGRIVEEGDHEGLMARSGQYAALYNTYFRHQSLDYRPWEGDPGFRVPLDVAGQTG